MHRKQYLTKKSSRWWSPSANGFTRRSVTLRNIRNLPHPPGKELVSGESALYLGRQYRIEVVKNGLTEVQFAHRFLIPATKGKNRVEALRNWYITKANEKILPRVKVHAYDLGVEVGEVKIVDNRYRWGSCTLKKLCAEGAVCITEDALPAFIEVVPAGISEIVRKQREGYVYVKP